MLTLATIQRSDEKILFSVAVLFSTAIWIMFLLGIFSPFYAKKVVEEPCVYADSSLDFYTDTFYGYFPVTSEELQNSFSTLSRNDCLSIESVPLEGRDSLIEYFSYGEIEDLCVLPEKYLAEAQSFVTYEYLTMSEARMYGEQNYSCLPKEDVPIDIWNEAYKKAEDSTVNPGTAIAAVLIVMALYGGMFALFLYVVKAMFMAYIRLNGVHLTSKQYQKFFEIYQEVGQDLQITKLPAAYIIDAGGDANAFAIKIARRHMVVFFSEIIERLVEDEKYDELRAIAAHELTHVKLKHTSYWLFLLPFSMIPFMGMLLSRMREYSADRGALFVVQNHQTVEQALLKIVAGRYVAKMVDIDEYIHSATKESGLFVLLSKLYATHPPIPFRIRELRLLAAMSNNAQNK